MKVNKAQRKTGEDKVGKGGSGRKKSGGVGRRQGGGGGITDRRGIILIIFLCTGTFSTLLHLPPLRLHCVGGCWDRTQNYFDFAIDSLTL